MRLSALNGKEVINFTDGTKLGILSYPEILFDPSSGNVDALIIPNKNMLVSLGGNQTQLTIPWRNVKKIGADTIIVEFERMGRRKLML